MEEKNGKKNTKRFVVEGFLDIIMKDSGTTLEKDD